MKKENWRGRNKKFGERSKPSGSLGEGKGDADLSSFLVLPFFFFFFAVLLCFRLCPHCGGPGRDFFTKCFFQ